jgi:hypothetical protein
MACDSDAIHLNVRQPAAFQNVKVLFFDLMGTCLDWHTSIVDALLLLPPPLPPPPPQPLPPSHRHIPSSDSSATAEKENMDDQSSALQSRLALRWRQAFFDEIHSRFESGKEAEDIDVTHRRALDRLLDADADTASGDGGDDDGGGGGGAPSWSEAQRQTRRGTACARGWMWARAQAAESQVPGLCARERDDEAAAGSDAEQWAAV